MLQPQDVRPVRLRGLGRREEFRGWTLRLLYVMTDDWYQKVIQPKLPVCGGPTPKLCDSEVLCLALAAQWRSGVPWQTERDLVRYTLKHLRPFFPGMTSHCAFNRRVRRLWGAFIRLQLAISDQLAAADDCEVLDCVPVRVAHGSRSFHPGWLAGIAAIGKGGPTVASMASISCWWSVRPVCRPAGR